MNTFTETDIEEITRLGFNDEQVSILQDAAIQSPEGSDKDELITDIRLMIENNGKTPDDIIAELKLKMANMGAAAAAGGRRHRGSKKAHKGKRHGNASLRAWVTFVKKVQKEEGIGYKDAMMSAKKRKDKGEKWRGGAPDDENDVMPMSGGRKRRRRTQRRSRSSRRSRSHRRSRRHH